MLESVLQAVAQVVPGVLCYHDTELRLRFFNEAYANLYRRLAGRSPQLGEKTTDWLSDPDFRAQVAEHCRRAAAGELVHVHYTFEAGGTTETWEVRYQPVYDADGRITGTLAWGRDVTVQQREQVFLRWLEVVLSQMHDMCMTWCW
ncbi:MAG: PAS domain-containing protein [Chloracidobacterium sp.]|nr:PAS domain-containing protein [Chloracidobacterium sp.]MDW8218170.1 PAS domain-containing protein [Acidobacteriota bacterium]